MFTYVCVKRVKCVEAVLDRRVWVGWGVFQITGEMCARLPNRVWVSQTAPTALCLACWRSWKVTPSNANQRSLMLESDLWG